MSQEFIEIENGNGVKKSYETVASRLSRFRKEHPQWSISTEIIYVDDEMVRVKASIGFYLESGVFNVLSSGHAEEYRLDGEINRTSAIENCETSAIGRALAFLGFGGSNSIASAEEVTGAKAKLKSIEENTPGALILLQNASKEGIKVLEEAWNNKLDKESRISCRPYMPSLKKQAAEFDRSVNNA